MKHIIGFISLVLLLSGCDDGDMSVTNFNFTSLSVSKCSNNTFIYNVNQNEALILDIPLNNFINFETIDENGDITPRIYTLNASDKLVYRLYNGAINNSILCSDFPVSEPQVTDEWTAIAGATVEITTVANPDTQNGGILGISGYTHHIVIKDAIFKKGNSQMVYEELVFGNYTTPNLIKFNFTDVVNNCPTNPANTLLYKLNLREALVMDLDQDLFPNEITNGTPRTRLINSVTNPIIYKVFDNNVTGAYFCSAIPQTSPNIVEEWYAQNGETTEDGTTGIIEVETEAVFDEITGDLVGYIHHITLKSVTFGNTNTSFTLEEYYVGGYGVEI